jgi:hypothetical protein
MNHKGNLNEDIAETTIRSEQGTKWRNEDKKKEKEEHRTFQRPGQFP